MSFYKQSNKISWSLVSLYALSIAGFPLVSAIPVLLGLESRPISVVYRAFIVCLSFVVLLYVGVIKKSLYIGRFWILMLYLWLIIILRLTWDSYFNSGIMVHPFNEYLLVMIGIGFIPMCAFFVQPNRDSLNTSFLCTLLLSIFTLVVLLYAATFVDPQYLVTGRLSTEVLNPISLGHLGVSVAILSMVFLHGRSSSGHLSQSALSYTFGVIGVCLGICVSIASISRGAIVSLVIVSSIYFVSSLKNAYKNLKTYFVVLTLILTMSFIIYYFESETLIQQISQLISASDFTEKSAALRTQMLRDGWDQFLNNPIVGSATVELNTGDYPHNIVVESFMATGIIGGMLLLSIIAISLRASWHLIRAGTGYNWVGLLYLQLLVAEMFSGSLFLGASIWNYSAAVIAIDNTL